MKFILKKASDISNVPEMIEINSLEDLKNLQEDQHKKFNYKPSEEWMKDCSLIIDFFYNTITIYDDWIE